ncbi:MAG: hypothetical protein OXH76_07810 [Boseongicola sp.]|nr:hypothetical protein [Boseongicola sp.]
MTKDRVFLIAYDIKKPETNRFVRSYIENSLKSVRLSESAYAVRTERSDDEIYDIIEAHLSQFDSELSHEDNLSIILLCKPATVKVNGYTGSWLDENLSRRY